MSNYLFKRVYQAHDSHAKQLAKAGLDADAIAKCVRELGVTNKKSKVA